MKIDSQRLGFKLQSLDQRYSRRVQQNLQASRETFCDLETPGWTSLMRSEISQKTKRAQIQKQSQNRKQSSIYNKLNELQKLDWSQKDEKKMIRSKGYDKNQTRDSDQARNMNGQSEQKSLHKNKPSQSAKRWNHITVHQHLYQNSHKLENKRMINKILDQEFKRKQIFKFTPTINKKSIILAESKFSRAKQNQFVIQEKAEETIQTEATQVKSKEDKDVERYRILNRTFYFLSQGKQVLSQKQLHGSAVKLPLPCLKVIQPIVSKIYQGDKMQWLDFLQCFNDKQIKGKESFFALMTKWFTRNQEKVANQTNQENHDTKRSKQ